MIMAANLSHKKNVNKQSGQALFEFIFFFPIMLILFVFMMNVGNAINGAINQQKITRSYFYARVKNNSMMPLADRRDSTFQQSWGSFGMFFIGWKESFADGTRSPIQPCYKLKLPFKEIDNECQAYSKTTTTYIRVGSVYGACGTTYYNSPQSVVIRGPATSAPGEVATKGACLISAGQ